MKFLILIMPFFIGMRSIAAQADLTLWITPDGYDHTHDHGSETQYFCEDSYYLFHHVDPDSVFVTLKNDGDQPLTIYQVAAQSIAGATFQALFSSPVTLLTGEMHSVRVDYQLPSIYANGINGHLDITSNDPSKPGCRLYFDVGCGPVWNIYGDEYLGLPGTCEAPVVHIEYSNDVVNPNLVYKDSMNFYTYEEISGTSFPIMHLWHKGLKVQRQLEAWESFGAGKIYPSPNSVFNLSVTKDKVEIARDLFVSRDVEINSDLKVQGTMQVNAITTPSDRRLKKNILNLNGALSTMMMLRPTIYSLRDPKPDTRQQYGFIAQEVQEVLPDLVHHDEDGQMSVNYMQIIPWLTAALQEQQKTIEDLRRRLDKLE